VERGHDEAYASDPGKNQKPSYDPLNDLTHITLMGTQPGLLLVGSQVPAKNLAKFVAMAKTKPGMVSYGSSGEGSAVHLAMETFSTQAGIRMIQLPYKGINPALMHVLSGQVQALFLRLQGRGEHSGRQAAAAGDHVTQALAAGARRADVPGIRLSRLPAHAVVRDRWAEGHAAGRVEKINHAVKAALAEPDARQKLVSGNTTVVGSTPEEARAFVAGEITRWKAAVRNAKTRQ
jgi:tripartite-type tricarboxylate transporter receptor subunit TctC